MKKKLFALFIAVIMIFTFAACKKNAKKPENPVVRVSTTTSVNDSGLLPELQPKFEEETGYKLEITSNGTGAAIALGEKGDADILLVHAKAAEEKFVEDGYGEKRIPFMYNYFVIVGPAADPAGVKTSTTAAQAFEKIDKDAKTGFVSRGDNSGTHKKELAIWKEAKIETTGKAYYISAGQGMAATLTQANERQAYALTDKGTFLSRKKDLNLEILLEKAEDMKNTYSLIPIKATVADGINTEGAKAFADWMTKESTLKLIGEYGKDKYGEALFMVGEVQ